MENHGGELGIQCPPLTRLLNHITSFLNKTHVVIFVNIILPDILAWVKV